LWLGTVPPILAQQKPFVRPSRVGSPGSQTSFAIGADVWSENGFVRIRYPDETEFLVNQAGTEVWATWPNSLTLEDTATYLIGPILGLVLHLRGAVMLHASVVRVGDVAVAFVGPQGAGKSTTAASFAMAGYAVLTDDVAAVREDSGLFQVIPAYPRIRLWPESVEMLFGSPDALPQLTPNWDKRYLELDDVNYRFESDAVPLGAIYFLHPRSDDLSEPIIVAETFRGGMVDLLGNLSGNYLLDQVLQASSFAFLGRLAEGVPLRRLVPRADPNCLADLRELIVADVAALRSPGDAARGSNRLHV
jgi:hypothetical protein